MTLTPDTFANNATSTIAGGAGGSNTALASGDTSLLLATGDGSKFPAAGPFMVLLGSLGGSWELVRCTARSSDTLTITRAQEGTTAQGWNVGTAVEQVVSAGNLTNLWTALNSGRMFVVTDSTYGAVGDGSTDDTSAINAAIAAAVSAGGGIVSLPATSSGYAISSTLTALSAAGVVLAGDGAGVSWLKPTAGFSGTQIIDITADFCGVRDLAIAYSSSLTATSSGNPAADGIQVSSARFVHLERLELRGINGWAIQSQGGASVANLGGVLRGIHILHCASGIHLQGDTGTGFDCQHSLTDIYLETCDTGDCLYIEDCHDVQVTNLNGAAGQGTATNSTVHLIGACSTILLTNLDIGVYPGGNNAPTMLLETNTNGDPTDIQCTGSMIQAGTTPLSITSGGNLTFTGVTFKQAETDGTDISSLTGTLTFVNCTWKANAQGGGTAYDISITSSASDLIYFRDCAVESPVGTGAALVTAPVNDPNHKGDFEGVRFTGSSVTPSTVFASGTSPQIIRHCVGYNPRGSITAPTIGATPYTTSTSQHDVTIIFTTVGDMSAFKIGGTAVSVVPVAGVPYHVPARQSLEIDYTSTAPTWQWLAD